MNLSRWRSLPLQKKLNIFGSLSSGLLLLTSVCCILFFSYVLFHFEQSIGDSYQQSSLLNSLTQLNEDVSGYGTYPTSGAQNKIAADLNDVHNLLSRFEENRLRQNDEQRLLLRALTQTMESYETALRKLYRLQPANGMQSQLFSIQHGEAAEIGAYADTYAKQLIQVTLDSGRREYTWIQANIQWLALVLIILFILSSILNVQFRRLVSAQIIRPVMTLASAASSLAANNLAIPDIEAETQDEIGALIQSFNRMKADCRSLIAAQEKQAALEKHLFDETIRRIDTEKQLSSVRFSMLKNQINPHFLFNALNLILQTAHQENAAETEQLIEQLSALLRYTLYNDRDVVPLSTELAVLRSFMYIQESRFQNRLLFWVECGADPDEIMIPSFTLQPLAENAVSHGISPKKDGGMLRVKITERQGTVSISITDSGVGIDKNTLMLLRGRRYMRQNGTRKSGGIGVENVSVRFSMLYPNGLFRIRSKAGMGTDILLRFRPSEMRAGITAASSASMQGDVIRSDNPYQEESTL